MSIYSQSVKSLQNYELSREIYISQEVREALKMKWNALFFPKEDHVFIEMLHDKYLFRVVSKGPVVLKEKKTGAVLENKDEDEIRRIILENRMNNYIVEVNNNICFETLAIREKHPDGGFVTETLYIADEFAPGYTVPHIISNFLKKCQEAYMEFSQK